MPNKRAHAWKALRAWLLEPLGQALINSETQKVQKIINRLFGYHLLLLGEPPFLKLVNQSPIFHRVFVHPEMIIECEGSPVQSRQDKLPFLSDEIDVLCLAHCLENIQNPHEVLRESHRVIKAEGHLIILGFNPWSVWGIWRLLRRYIKPVPWDGQFISRSRLKDWLSLLGFDLLKVEMCFFRPPINSEGFLKRSQWLEWLGRFLWPFAGASYILLAQKRVLTLTAVKPAWAERKRVVPGRLVEPAPRL
jgi:SAM-dependent methyltransferase